MIEHYLAAFVTIFQPQNILAMVLGGLWGIIAGALPGISTSMGVVLLIPFTFAMSPLTAFIMVVFSKFIAIPFPRGIGIFAELSRFFF